MITNLISSHKQLITLSYKTKKQKLLKFLFPYYPLRWRYSTYLIIFLAALISLRFLTQIFSIPIGPVLRISFNWIPTSLIGWMFGPVLAIPLGIIIDSITFFWSGGVWFWMYAIQEPLIMCLSGIIGGIYQFRKEFKNWIWDYLFLQIIFLFFVSIAIIALLTFASNKFENTNLDFIGLSRMDTVYLSISVIVIFFVSIQVIIHLLLYYKKIYQKQLILFIYVILLVFLLSIIFSFILGTISAINFYKYISGDNSLSPNFLIYGSYYYLIPRVIKEIFKAPLLIIILVNLVKLSNSYLIKIQQLSYQKW
ncbi:hypothetical protein [Mycoplasmoides pirum]|uniref:hypothetical protein n=1 Tax=Mycoplasmoides pirum TaxID=2122 RepID=UPI0004840CC1|nr:hypothetical protein [Mycoplasmoides pirum]